MLAQPRWSKWSAIGIAAGVFWVTQATSLGGLASLPLWIAGSLLLASGVSQLLWPGDERATQMGAFGGLLGLVISIPAIFVMGFVTAVGLAASAVAAAWGAGRMALQLEPFYEGVPRPTPSVGLAAKVAVDDLILGFEQWTAAGFALDGTLERTVDEIERMHSRFEEEGLFEKPDAYHQHPPDLETPEIQRRDVAGHAVDVLRFESGYAPADGEPGRERWMGYDPCRDGWAYALRHQGPPRPWLIATNGYRMGFARMDVGLFERFHQKLGLNVLIPVLPLHGPRRIGLHSGSGFLGIDVIDTLHAEAQAIWDMRRLLSWVRAQDAPAVGAFGLSLGGYTTSLFASIADGLACAIPGIPLADIPRMLRRHGAAHQMRYAESRGYDYDRIEEVMRVVSPLTLHPKVPHRGRMIFGATADRLVTPDQVRDLWRHWEEPEMVWYEGTHVSFMNETDVWAGVDRTLRDSGLAI